MKSEQILLRHRLQGRRLARRCKQAHGDLLGRRVRPSGATVLAELVVHNFERGGVIHLEFPLLLFTTSELGG